MPDKATANKAEKRLFLSLGEPARKTIREKYPDLFIWTIQARGLIENCTNCFHIAKKEHWIGVSYYQGNKRPRNDFSTFVTHSMDWPQDVNLER